MKVTQVLVKKLFSEARIPRKAHDDDAGWDLYANSIRKVGFLRYEYGSGIAIEMPKGYEAQVRARSSIFTTGFILSNGMGTIDAGYRGEIKAVFWKIPFIGKPYKIGERFCQLVFKEVPEIKLKKVKELNESSRGEGGYGSTGRN